MDVKLKCRCGKFRGTVFGVSPTAGNRIVCLCDDCQAYAHALGRAKDILDENGGTEIFPVRPSNLKFTEGVENLNCLRLSEKGLLRWYAGCCNTPIANSLPYPKMPFTGLFLLIMDHESSAQTCEEALGPVRARVQGRYGIGKLKLGTHQSAPIGIILSTIWFLVLGFMRRQHKPSPYWDSKTGELAVIPTVLSKDARENLRPFCGPKPPL